MGYEHAITAVHGINAAAGMTLERIQELRQIANQHKGHKSADYMIELLDYTDELRKLYALSLEFGWSDFRSKSIAFSQLKKLASR